MGEVIEVHRKTSARAFVIRECNRTSFFATASALLLVFCHSAIIYRRQGDWVAGMRWGKGRGLIARDPAVACSLSRGEFYRFKSAGILTPLMGAVRRLPTRFLRFLSDCRIPTIEVSTNKSTTTRLLIPRRGPQGGWAVRGSGRCTCLRPPWPRKSAAHATTPHNASVGVSLSGNGSLRRGALRVL